MTGKNIRITDVDCHSEVFNDIYKIFDKYKFTYVESFGIAKILMLELENNYINERYEDE